MKTRKLKIHKQTTLERYEQALNTISKSSNFPICVRVFAKGTLIRK